MTATPVPVPLTAPVLHSYATAALLKGVIRAGGTKKSTRKISRCRVTSSTAGECHFWVYFPATFGWPANTCSGTVFVQKSARKIHYRLESEYCA